MVLWAIDVIHKRIYFIIRDLCEIKVHHSNFLTIPLLAELLCASCKHFSYGI